MTLRGQEALQWDLDRLEHWAISHSMKFTKGNAGCCPWDRTMPDRHRLGAERLESSPAERVLGVLVPAGSAGASSVPWLPGKQTALWGALSTA